MEQRVDRRGNRWRVAIWGSAALLLLLPWVAREFTREVNWTPADFGVFGAMLPATLRTGPPWGSRWRRASSGARPTEPI